MSSIFIFLNEVVLVWSVIIITVTCFLCPARTRGEELRQGGKEKAAERDEKLGEKEKGEATTKPVWEGRREGAEKDKLREGRGEEYEGAFIWRVLAGLLRRGRQICRERERYFGKRHATRGYVYK